MACCEEIAKRLCEELSEDVDSEVCEEMRKHLEECEDCRNEVQSVRETVHLFQCIKGKPIPKDIHERLLTILNLEKENA